MPVHDGQTNKYDNDQDDDRNREPEGCRQESPAYAWTTGPEKDQDKCAM